MNVSSFINEWIAASNAFNTQAYLRKFHEDAVLNDPSVGKTFTGHQGIKEYFDNYFIGYNTHTRLLKLTIGNHQAHIIVEFTGTFPGGRICGTFDFIFENNKIKQLKADLI